MIIFSELISTLRVTKYKINIINLDYIKLSLLFKPASNVITINNNFIHLCLDGYLQFLTKPKSKFKPKRDSLYTGNHFVFNAYIEFTVNLSYNSSSNSSYSNITVIYYLPRLGIVVFNYLPVIILLLTPF